AGHSSPGHEVVQSAPPMAGGTEKRLRPGGSAADNRGVALATPLRAPDQCGGPPVRHRSSFLLTLLLAPALHAALARAADEDPFSLAREEATVTGAAKRPQPVSQSPSAISILTAAEIRTMGYHTLGDALRYVRGLFVCEDRNYTYVGIRGIQRPGDYNIKVLLTIDGHAMNGPLYGDAAFGGEIGVSLEDVERIEVVRGPGSALFGSNAVLAVINVVMRPPQRATGARLSGRTGSGGDHRGYAAFGAAPPVGPSWYLTGAWSNVRGTDQYYAEYDSPLTHGGVASQMDGSRDVAVYGTVEWLGLRLAGKFNDRWKRVPTGAYGTVFNDPAFRTRDGHDFLELSGRRTLRTVELNGRAYWDAVRYRGRYPFDYGSGVVVNVDRSDADVVGGELRAHWPF